MEATSEAKILGYWKARSSADGMGGWASCDESCWECCVRFEMAFQPKIRKWPALRSFLTHGRRAVDLGGPFLAALAILSLTALMISAILVLAGLVLLASVLSISVLAVSMLAICVWTGALLVVSWFSILVLGALMSAGSVWTGSSLVVFTLTISVLAVSVLPVSL